MKSFPEKSVTFGNNYPQGKNPKKERYDKKGDRTEFFKTC